jgi:hypothetical protein
MSQQHGYYVLRAIFPDTTRIMIGNFIWATTDVELVQVYDRFKGMIALNPDVKVDPENFLLGPYISEAQYKPVVDKLLAELKAADPDRVSVAELKASGTFDHAARLLHDPEISRFLAARKAAKANGSDTSADAPLKTGIAPSPSAENDPDAVSAPIGLKNAAEELAQAGDENSADSVTKEEASKVLEGVVRQTPVGKQA